MNEDKTKDLTDSEKLNLILTELADLKTRIVKLEAFAEDRSRETRPVLDKIHKEIADTRAEVGGLRADVSELKEGQKRVEEQLLGVSSVQHFSKKLL